MRVAVKQFIAISKSTTMEALRQPICLIITTVCVLFITLLPLIITHTLGETGKLVRDSAFASFFLFGIFLSCYTAATTVEQEIKRGTVATILSKPISRELFITAKFFGVMTVIVMFAVMCTMATMVSSRSSSILYEIDWWSAGPLLVAPVVSYFLGGCVNFFTRRSFTSNAFFFLFIGVLSAFVITGFIDREGHMQEFGLLYGWNLIPAGILICAALLLLQGFAVALSTHLEAIPTLTICSALFLLGLISDYLFGRQADTQLWAAFLYAIVPNWQNFWMADAITDNGSIPLSYLNQALQYSALYLAALLGITLLSFKNVEVS